MAWRKPANLSEWVEILIRHRKKAFFPSVLVMITVFTASFWFPRQYYAEAKFQRVNDQVIQQTDAGIVGRALNQTKRVIIEDIKGRAAVERLVEDLELPAKLKFPHTPDGSLTEEGQFRKFDLVNSIKNRINVYYQTQSDQIDVVVVNFTHSDPDLAPKVVNQIVENYISSTRDQLDKMLIGAKDFFEKEVARYRARISELEQRLIQFERNNAGLTPDDPMSVQAKLVALRAQFDRVRSDLAVAIQQRDSLTQWLDEQDEFVVRKRSVDNPEVVYLRQRVRDLELAYEQNRQLGRRDAHPEQEKLLRRINEVKRQIEGSDEKLDEEVDREPNIQRLEGQKQIKVLTGSIIALERQEKELASQVDHFEILNRNFFAVRNDYRQLQSDLGEARDQARFWNDMLRRTTIAISADLQQRGVRLSSILRANDIPRPSDPKLSKILLYALVGGLGTALAMILLAELMDRSFHGVEQAVDDLKLPVLGAVNEIVTPSAALRRKIMGLGLYPLLSALLVAILLSLYVMVRLNLEQPQRFEQLIKQIQHPQSFIRGHYTP